MNENIIIPLLVAIAATDQPDVERFLSQTPQIQNIEPWQKQGLLDISTLASGIGDCLTGEYARPDVVESSNDVGSNFLGNFTTDFLARRSRNPMSKGIRQKYVGQKN